MVRKLEDYLHDDEMRDGDDRNLVSRTEVRREKQRLEAIRFDIATKLTRLKPSQLARLSIPEPCLEVIDEVRVIESAPARTRAIKRLRAELRDVDLDALASAIARLDEPRATQTSPATEWLNRLVNGGDEALQQFVDAYPRCDRAQLRSLVRNLRRAQPSDKGRAEAKLRSVIDQQLLVQLREVDEVPG